MTIPEAIIHASNHLGIAIVVAAIVIGGMSK